MEKEYVVTLKSFDELDQFYDDMETPGGNLYIPGRVVDCALRRNISRNTHYMLTDDEAEQLRSDPRVVAVELLPSELGIEPVAFWTQTGNFEKSSTVDSNDKNWGLLRCINGIQTSGWGTDGGAFTQQTSQTIKTTSSGKDVDVVIVDAHVNPNHPEFAVNPDGSGGGRVNTIDWFQYSQYVGINTTNTYDYSTLSSNHGTHVAGTACGNTQGWARDANIYTIEFNYPSSPVYDWALILFDYLRAFHKNKPINPNTGRRNPTITNHSWGYSYNDIDINTVQSVTYRGTTTSLSSLTAVQKKQTLEANGVPVPVNGTLYRIPARYAALDADIQDAINDGIIVVSSAGNSYWNCAVPASQDYNNYISTTTQTIYHSRGSSPGAASNVICVGSISSSHVETKSNFSNWGSRVDVWAPGTNVISSVYNTSAASEFGITLVNDPRTSSYKLGSISGTSMASPQVCGVIACLAEQYPSIKQQNARDYIISNAKTSQIRLQVGQQDWIESGSKIPTESPYTTLSEDSNNRYLYYRLERPFNGSTSPKVTYRQRPTTGHIFPRIRNRR
ncbi:peptidase [Synechococcus phage S-CREM1]|nr:peptidase [Synechococcus phage S-CREM1]